MGNIRNDDRILDGYLQKDKGTKKKNKTQLIAFACILVAVLVAGVLLGKNLFVNDTIATVNEALMPLEIIETFEISALEYRYRNIVFEENIEERKFVFIPLEPAVKRYAVQYDGEIKMGINAADLKIEIEKQSGGEKSILTVTVPNAYIISHTAPLNDTFNVIFDESEHTERFTLGEYANTLNEKKKETETEANQSGLIEQAQESARKQLDSFLRAIPDIRDNYTLVFVLE